MLTQSVSCILHKNLYPKITNLIKLTLILLLINQKYFNGLIARYEIQALLYIKTSSRFDLLWAFDGELRNINATWIISLFSLI